MADFDVVIVGAGHNGLTAGCYLARNGRRVIIVERGSKVGGMTTSGFMIPEAPQHLVTPCAVDVIFMRGTGIIEDLELVKHGFKTYDPDPSYAYLHPDGNSIALFRDPKRTAEDMARLSKADGKSYMKFMEVTNALMDIAFPLMNTDAGRPSPRALVKMIGALIRHRGLRAELQNLAAGTADQIACEYFEHPASIGLLAGVAAITGPIDEDGSAAAYMLFSLMHRLGVGKPLGSLQTLSNALAKSFIASGGSIRLNAQVAEIIIEGGKTRGVRVEDGSIITANSVIASCDPHTAYKLTTPGGIEKRLVTRMEHAPANRSNCAPMLINIAMSKPLSLKRHQDMRHDDADLNKACGLIGTPDQVRNSFATARRGDISKTHAIALSPLSNWEPAQAPSGQSIAHVYLQSIAVEAREGWSDELKTRTLQGITAQLSEFYDGFDAQIGNFLETPMDRAKRLNLTNGCVTHIDFGAARTGLKRPAFGLGGTKPVVPGFFLGGAGTHPGGGVSGLPGKIAAERVDRWLKKSI
jgi:phytoene dehydrogenase-like protein